MPTAPQLIRAEIKRRTDAKAKEYGYDPHSGEYEDQENEEINELRCSYTMEAEGIAAWTYSRHYDCKPVVMQLEGKWVCWLYWYGGGKHGEPDGIEWIDDAIFVEEGEPIVKKTFTPIERT